MTVLLCDDSPPAVPRVMNHDQMQRYLESICTRIAKAKRDPVGNGGEILRLQGLAESVSRAMGQRKQIERGEE